MATATALHGKTRWGVYSLMPAIVIVGFLMDRRMLRLHNAPP